MTPKASLDMRRQVSCEDDSPAVNAADIVVAVTIFLPAVAGVVVASIVTIQIVVADDRRLRLSLGLLLDLLALLE